MRPLSSALNLTNSDSRPILTLSHWPAARKLLHSRQRGQVSPAARKTPAGASATGGSGRRRVADRTAAAERNQLAAELRAAISRADQLQSVSTALAEAQTTAGVGEAVVALFEGLFGADFVTVMLLAADARTVRFLRLQAVPDAVARLMAEVPRAAPSATSDALRRREDIFHSTLVEYLSDYPHLEAATRALGVRALAHLPLVAAGRLLGLLSISWRDERDFGPHDRLLLRNVASQCALAIQRTELVEQKTEITSILQRAILPQTLPRFPGVRLAARYLPAEANAEVGGDWYDAFAGPDGALWLSVGDVGGHGVSAASGMAQLRSAVRATAFAGLAPAAALDVLDRLLTSTGDGQVASAVVARFEPQSDRVTWSSSGHMPPVRQRSQGGTDLLDVVLGPLLGLDLGGRTEAQFSFGPGDVLVLYTDGLVENRGEDLDVGLSRLLDAVAVRRDPPDPGEVADAALASSLAGVARQDDLCILVAVREPLETGS